MDETILKEINQLTPWVDRCTLVWLIFASTHPETLQNRTDLWLKIEVCPESTRNFSGFKSTQISTNQWELRYSFENECTFRQILDVIHLVLADPTDILSIVGPSLTGE